MRTSLAVGLSALLWAQAAAAEAPLSAIDWLSDSVAPPEPSRQSVLPPQVEVSPLDERALDGVGLMTAQAAGLPADLWARSRAEDVAAAFEALPRDLAPPLADLVVRLATVAAEPPMASTEELLTARVDRLLSLARLALAQRLLDAAEISTPELFRRRFDVQLLTGAEDRGCAELERRPDIAPTYSARIFCLARRGDWPAAALTLETAEALDVLDPGAEVMLARFLQDGSEDLLPPPRRPQQVSPLEFRIFEAIGEPLPTRSLPLPFARAELRPTIGWKARIEAGERLARAGALPGEALVDLYTERRPAASGGVWERAAAMRALAEALAADDAEALAAAARAAYAAMAEADLLHPLAEAFGRALAAALPESDAAQRLGLLSDSPGAAARALAPRDPELAFLASVARGAPAPPPPGASPLLRAIHDAWAEAGPPAAVRDLLAQERTGEAMLHSVDALARSGDPRDIAAALAALRRLGLEGTARRTALWLALAEAP